MSLTHNLTERTKVEHASEPLIVITNQPQIFLDAHDARVGKGCLFSVTSVSVSAFGQSWKVH